MKKNVVFLIFLGLGAVMLIFVDNAAAKGVGGFLVGLAASLLVQAAR